MMYLAHTLPKLSVESLAVDQYAVEVEKSSPITFEAPGALNRIRACICVHKIDTMHL